MTINVPPVWIAESAFEKFFAYIQIAQGEVGGFGETYEVDGTLRITDIHLIKQVTTDARTLLDMHSVGGFMREMMAKGKDISLFRTWWHSHAYYQVGWSKDTDVPTIQTLSKKKYLVSIVGNKYRHFTTRYDIQTPEPFVMQAFPLRVYTGDQQVAYNLTDLEREVAEKVTYIPTPVTVQVKEKQNG